MKKVKWKRWLFTFLCSLLFTGSYAQTTIKGTIFNRSNEPLIGATVSVKGTSNGTAADIDGKFSLNVPSANATVVVSFVGYQTQTVELNGRTKLNFILDEDSQAIEQVVVVGYGTQKKQSVTGSISAVNLKELKTAATSSVSTMLAGRLPGLVTTQRSGAPGADEATMTIRGSQGTPLAIVDGVNRDINQIDPNEIESVTILKDAASCAVYGLQGANGVILVTTKRGRSEKPSITYSGNFSISQNTRFPEFMNGPEYAYYHNKAREMDGLDPIFSKSDVDKMINGDPEGKLGNTNWVDKIFQTGFTQQHNISVNGGSEKVKYFLSAGYFDQEGNVKSFNFNRYNLRSNVDAKISKDLTVSLDLAGRLEERRAPRLGVGKNDAYSIVQQAIRSHPYLPETYNGLPVASPTAHYGANAVAARDQSGFNNTDRGVFQSTLNFKYDVPWIKGLSAKAALSYDHDYIYSKIYSTSYKLAYADMGNFKEKGVVYNPNYTSAGIGQNVLTEGMNRTSRVTGQYSLNYANVFGDHSVTGLILWEHSKRSNNKFQVSGAGFEIPNLPELDHSNGILTSTGKGFSGMGYEYPRAGLVARVTYDYKAKYLVEASTRYDGSYLFNKNTRWDLFPSVSLGWRISAEDFFKNNISFIDNLKLRASAGRLGDDSGVPEMMFLRQMRWVNANPITVIGGVPNKGLMVSNYADPNITWDISTIYNAGFEATMWAGLLGVEFDVYYRLRENMLMQQGGNYPPSMGGNYPKYVNNGRMDYRGVDFQITHRNRIGQVNYSAKLTMNWARSKWLTCDDSPNLPEWQRRTGNPYGQKDGFIAEGIFQSWEEIANSAVISDKTKPGDIKFKDINGDGKITYDQDRTFIGKSSTPELMAGLNLTADWKGFDFSIFFQGAAISDVALMGWYDGVGWDNTEFTKSFYGGGNSPIDLVSNSWTPDNTGAKYPRLSTGSTPNGYSNTIWMINGNYLRLKNVQLGYNFKTNWIKKIGASALRVYFTGDNLATWSHNPFLDPEAPDVANGYYPQQKTYTFGINLTF